MRAIKSKTSTNYNTANPADSGTEISPKASDDKDFFDEIYPEEEPSQNNERKTLDCYKNKVLMAVQRWYLPIFSKIQIF